MEDFEHNFAKEEKFDCGVWNLTEKEDGIQHLHSWWVQGIASMLVGTIGFVYIVLSNRFSCSSTHSSFYRYNSDTFENNIVHL